MSTDEQLQRLLEREARAANLEDEAEHLDETGAPSQAAALRDRAGMLRAQKCTSLPISA